MIFSAVGEILYLNHTIINNFSHHNEAVYCNTKKSYKEIPENFEKKYTRELLTKDLLRNPNYKAFW